MQKISSARKKNQNSRIEELKSRKDSELEEFFFKEKEKKYIALK